MTYCLFHRIPHALVRTDSGHAHRLQAAPDRQRPGRPSACPRLCRCACASVRRIARCPLRSRSAHVRRGGAVLQMQAHGGWHAAAHPQQRRVPSGTRAFSASIFWSYLCSVRVLFCLLVCCLVQDPTATVEIVVVDDGSSDDSADFVDAELRTWPAAVQHQRLTARTLRLPQVRGSPFVLLIVALLLVG